LPNFGGDVLLRRAVGNGPLVFRKDLRRTRFAVFAQKNYVSLPESILQAQHRAYFGGYRFECNKDILTKRGSYNCDVVLPGFKIVVNYDGAYYHKNI